MALTQKGAARRRKRIEELERPAYGWIWKPLFTLLVLYLVVCVGLGIWWSRTPAPFDVEQAVVDQRGTAVQAPASRGAVTVAGLMTLVETLLEKPGGYLRNDIAPPGVWLDNMPAWELGVLAQARRLSVALPAMEQSDLPVLGDVQQRLAGDSGDWLYPSTEQRLQRALEGLDGYLKALGEGGEAAFGDGGQGVAAWLEALARSLDDLGLRLSASIGTRAELRDLDIDAEALPARTPWYRVDDVFFEARGQAWAMLHLLRAVQRDQADMLAEAGLAGRWEALVAELELSQRRLWSPMVLNGSGFGLFANHSLVLANHMIRARDLSRSLAGELAAAEQEADADRAAPVEPAPDAEPEAPAGETDAVETTETGSAGEADGEIPAYDQAEVADGAADAGEPTGSADGEGVAAAEPAAEAEAEAAPATGDSPEDEAAGGEAAVDEAAEDEAVGDGAAVEAPRE
ncbi:hypothetical protein FIU83_06600 [Halomonas sp. THAF5a]|uniref:DUF2333 family protein n=1 Tax=Halomonas sp. THAF5a TaxID=2587844 RepID=UPI0012AA4640|nr:DUF2333 family protein [Halomonas sp. THAF5a]QFU01305.1 hypothetical protein FIU83_06600 [Halomonas sp. THAF5a]